jgi:hypothetical protein
VKVDLGDSPEVIVRDRALSILESIAVGTLYFALRQHLSIVCPSASALVTLIVVASLRSRSRRT